MIIALLIIVRILQKVLENWRGLLSLGPHSEYSITTQVKITL